MTVKRARLWIASVFLAGLLAASPHPAQSQHAGHGGHAGHAGHAGHGPYAGQDKREVTSLSDTDLVALRAGQGWGLALPAELNGIPGPLHVLELAEKLELSPEQKSSVTNIFDRMRGEAIAAGAAYIAAEAALDEAFRSGSLDRAALAEKLAASAAARARLREAHLAAHLETAPLLNPHQRHVYQFERGYGGPFAEKQGHGAQGHGKP